MKRENKNGENKNGNGNMTTVGNRFWKAGMPSPNPGGRPPVGMSIAEFGRVYLETNTGERGVNKSRLLRIYEALYTIACDPSNKQATTAANILLNRSYGPVLEISEKEAMLLALSKFPQKYKDRIAGLLFKDTESTGIIIPDENLIPNDEEEKLDESEFARFTEIS